MTRKTYSEKTSPVPPPYQHPPICQLPLLPVPPTPLPFTPHLQILAATFGGIPVTAALAGMMSSSGDELALDMATLVDVLRPDPAPGVVKRLVVVYEYIGLEDEKSQGPVIVLASEASPVKKFTINKDLTRSNIASGATTVTSGRETHGIRVWPLTQPYSSSPPLGSYVAPGTPPPVQILAATYGPKVIDTPAVLEALADFFNGRMPPSQYPPQLRLGNEFFRQDPHVGVAKEWSVFFRFGGGRVQCVTGWENSVLQEPWSRWI